MLENSTTEDEAALDVGDRVAVDDWGLKRLREIMRDGTGQEPAPNHHGVIIEIWSDESVLVEFDDDHSASPWPMAQLTRLPAPAPSSVS